LRSITAVILFLLAIMSPELSSYSEPETQSRFHFAAPVRDPNHPKRPILLGSFKRGLDVILINEKETCKVKTGSAFSFEYVYGPDDLVKATNLSGMEKCPKRFTIALVGASSESVQLHSPKLVQSPLHKDAELRAYRLVEPVTPAPEDPYGLASPHPLAFEVGRFTLLKFKWKGEGDEGPFLLYFEGQLFQPEGNCASGHAFFSVKEKLYLTYHEGGCFSGVNTFYVYDLSGASPRMVYSGDMST
jgi:hypothetical protein